jgi:hypothetical protein
MECPYLRRQSLLQERKSCFFQVRQRIWVWQLLQLVVIACYTAKARNKARNDDYVNIKLSSTVKSFETSVVLGSTSGKFQAQNPCWLQVKQYLASRRSVHLMATQRPKSLVFPFCLTPSFRGRLQSLSQLIDNVAAAKPAMPHDIKNLYHFNIKFLVVLDTITLKLNINHVEGKCPGRLDIRKTYWWHDGKLARISTPTKDC